jgi:hypothetical protein
MALATKAGARASDVRIPREMMAAIPGGIMAIAVRVASAFGANNTSGRDSRHA